MIARWLCASALMVVGLALSAQAGTPPPPPTNVTKHSSSEETIISIGLRFSFGDMIPKVVGAVRRTTTDKVWVSPEFKLTLPCL